MITGPVGIPVISSRTTSIRGCASMISLIRRANSCRSTTSAVPPGTRASSATRSSSEPSARISVFSNPCALVGSTDLNEFVQTTSARRSVWCASVPRTGRISWSLTSCPRSASWYAASDPESPPPTTVTCAIVMSLLSYESNGPRSDTRRSRSGGASAARTHDDRPATLPLRPACDGVRRASPHPAGFFASLRMTSANASVSTSSSLLPSRSRPSPTSSP
jgi:hypothetical protein